MFLQRMAFAGNVHGDFFTVRKPHAGDLPESRVRLLRCHGAYQQAHTALLRALIQNGRLAELPLRSSATADKLVYCGHSGAFCRGKRAKSVETNKFTPLRGAVKGGKLTGGRRFSMCRQFPTANRSIRAWRLRQFDGLRTPMRR